MDGTLLNHEEIIGPRNADAIRGLQARGVIVTIASGRSFREAREICEASGIEPYIISSNGAQINDAAGRMLEGIFIDRALALDIAKWLDAHQYYYEFTGESDVFTVRSLRERHEENFETFKRDYPEPESLLRGLGLEYKLSLRKIGIVDSYHDYFAREKNTYKIHVLSPELDRLEVVKNKFRSHKELEMVSSLDHNAEVMSSAASKGASVQKLAELLGLSLEHTMAIGDNLNDLSMLRIVKYPVAMGNARDEVKKICRYTTRSDHEDGVAHAIERFDEIEWK